MKDHKHPKPARAQRQNSYPIKSANLIRKSFSKIPQKTQKTFSKPIDKHRNKCYNIQARIKRLVEGAAKTSASHAENMGSIPVRVTMKKALHKCGVLFSL